MYLFDTDTISNVLKRKPSARLLDRLRNILPGEQFISTVTISEIVYGAMRSARPEVHLRSLETVLLPSVQIVAFDVAAAYEAGRIRADLERAGESLSFTDIQIAAIAIAHDMLLVTGNLRHFERIKILRVENWM